MISVQSKNKYCIRRALWIRHCNVHCKFHAEPITLFLIHFLFQFIISIFLCTQKHFWKNPPFKLINEKNILKTFCISYSCNANNKKINCMDFSMKLIVYSSHSALHIHIYICIIICSVQYSMQSWDFTRWKVCGHLAKTRTNNALILLGKGCGLRGRTGAHTQNLASS